MKTDVMINKPKLKNIKIILVETTHPGNIGAVARAMKNMCLDRLVLVQPKALPDHADAIARASGANDLLASAEIYDTLDEALKGCRLVVGASARLRNVAVPQYAPRECAGLMLDEAAQGEVALVFGRERSGLTNAEMDRCQYLVHIPANPDYTSLNISQAVQVLSYELYMTFLDQQDAGQVSAEQHSEDLATADDMEGLYQHLEQAMEDLGFSTPGQSNKLQRRMRRLFFRARPSREELNILRGFFSAAQGRKSMRRS